MKLILTFQTHDLVLPLSYRHAVQGMLYRILRAEPDVSAALHDIGLVSEKKKYKLFVFRQLTGSYRIVGRNIVFPEETSLEIRCAEETLAGIIAEECPVGRELLLNGQRITVTGVRVFDPAPIESGEIFAEQITVHRTDGKGHTVYFSPDDPEFCEAVRANAARKWERTGSTLPFSFSIRTIPGARHRKTVTVFKGTYITAWSGRFLIAGSEPLLSFLYSTGIGDRNSQGFGAFEQV